jgi:hypothetical protein
MAVILSRYKGGAAETSESSDLQRKKFFARQLFTKKAIVSDPELRQ